MIFAVHVWKTADGLLYVKARDEGQVWDYIDNNDINMDDVVWGEDYMGDYPSHVESVKRNKKGEIVTFLEDVHDEKDFEDDSTFKRDDIPRLIVLDDCKDDDDEDPDDDYYFYKRASNQELDDCMWNGTCGSCPDGYRCPIFKGR